LVFPKGAVKAAPFFISNFGFGGKAEFSFWDAKNPRFAEKSGCRG
jgi:hypothetical protein